VTLVVIYLVGMALCFAELFAPGIVMGVVGGILVLYAVVAAFFAGSTLTGMTLLAITVVAVPLMARYGLRRISLDSSSPAEGGAATEAGLDALVGKHGVALTSLRPAGVADIEGRRVSVVAELGFVEAETPVSVLRVEGNRVVVRPRTTAAPPRAEVDRNRI